MYDVLVTVQSINLAAAKQEVETSKRVAHTVRAIARDLRAAAIKSFESQDLGHSTDPFRYIESFRIVQVGTTFRVENIDPTAVMVEYGSHAGGVTPVLGYAPFRNGIDAIVRDWNSSVRLI